MRGSEVGRGGCEDKAKACVRVSQLPERVGRGRGMREGREGGGG